MAMVILDHWRRICGLHVTDAGDVACVWIAHDRQDTDVCHLFDSAFYRQQPMAVISEGINGHGRYVPIAWEHAAKGTITALIERGANVIPEKHCLHEDAALAEVMAKEVRDRMLSERFKVSERASEWWAEYKTFYREDAEVPRDSHPLMAATRYAVAMLRWAQPARAKRRVTAKYTKLAIV